MYFNDYFRYSVKAPINSAWKPTPGHKSAKWKLQWYTNSQKDCIFVFKNYSNVSRNLFVSNWLCGHGYSHTCVGLCSSCVLCFKNQSVFSTPVKKSVPAARSHRKGCQYPLKKNETPSYFIHPFKMTPYAIKMHLHVESIKLQLPV
jgi:hypothetical protein